MGMIGNTLAQGLISGANIQDGTVDTPDLKDSAVTAAKIATGVVTPAKLSTGAPTWDSDGKLGVGSTSPSQRLVVQDTSAIHTAVNITNSSGNYNIGVTGPSNTWGAGTGALVIRDSSAGASRFVIDSGGNVGIGTAVPGALFHVKGANSLSSNTRYLKARVGGAGSWGTNAWEELGVGFSGIRSIYTGGDYWALSFTTGTSDQFEAGTQAEVGRFDASGNLLLGRDTQAYSAKIVREDNSNSAVQSMLVRNVNSGSSASCGYYINSYGNSWSLEVGSTAKNSNAFSIINDPLGTPAEKLRISTGGILTKFDASTSTYVRDHGTYTVANTYLHIKFNLTKSTEKMLGFRLYGYRAYDAFTDTYYGCYLYNAVSYPYGTSIRDAGSASGGAIYYAADGYLVISCLTNANNYTGLRLESLVNGGDYGGGVDVQVLAYKGHSANTGAY
jgi:hypothetical protein